MRVLVQKMLKTNKEARAPKRLPAPDKAAVLPKLPDGGERARQERGSGGGGGGGALAVVDLTGEPRSVVDPLLQESCDLTGEAGPVWSTRRARPLDLGRP
ncbi:hypothetical protein WJX81_007372 [Elliptochloris bilobata]|uniref:Uncharacterized protein n=1 Tax=Elliptochloris bilobata TaxID=381761 RepID=A0AAW1S2M2_9CHLO